jgi:hypothetical protein
MCHQLLKIGRNACFLVHARGYISETSYDNLTIILGQFTTYDNLTISS